MSSIQIDILEGLFFSEIQTGGGCTAFQQGQDEKGCDEYILITDTDVEACAPTEKTVRFSACKYSNQSGEATSPCAMGLTFRQLLDWLRENPTDTLIIVDEIIIEVAMEATAEGADKEAKLNAAALVIQTALGQDDGGIAALFFNADAEVTEALLYEYLAFERSHEAGAKP